MSQFRRLHSEAVDHATLQSRTDQERAEQEAKFGARPTLPTNPNQEEKGKQELKTLEERAKQEAQYNNVILLPKPEERTLTNAELREQTQKKKEQEVQEYIQKSNEELEKRKAEKCNKPTVIPATSKSPFLPPSSPPAPGAPKSPLAKPEPKPKVNVPSVFQATPAAAAKPTPTLAVHGLSRPAPPKTTVAAPATVASTVPGIKPPVALPALVVPASVVAAAVAAPGIIPTTAPAPASNPAPVTTTAATTNQESPPTDTIPKNAKKVITTTTTTTKIVDGKEVAETHVHHQVVMGKSWLPKFFKGKEKKEITTTTAPGS
jgi:hypothetical protein